MSARLLGSEVGSNLGFAMQTREQCAIPAPCSSSSHTFLPYEYARAAGNPGYTKVETRTFPQGRPLSSTMYLPRTLISSIVQHKVKLCSNLLALHKVKKPGHVKCHLTYPVSAFA